MKLFSVRSKSDKPGNIALAAMAALVSIGASAQSAPSSLPPGASLVVDGRVVAVRTRHLPAADKIDDIRCTLELQVESVEGGDLDHPERPLLASGTYRPGAAADAGRVAKLGEVRIGSEVKLTLKAGSNEYEIMAPDGLEFVGPQPQ